MFLLRCPKCKHEMKYQNMKNLSKDSKKRCVYCGRSMSVLKSIVKKI